MLSILLLALVPIPDKETPAAAKPQAAQGKATPRYAKGNIGAEPQNLGWHRPVMDARLVFLMKSTP